MTQDQTTGAKGDAFGRAAAKEIARLVGAKLVRKSSNEAVLDGKRVVIKSAGRGNDKVGVSLQMLSHLDGIVAAFQNDDEIFEVYLLEPSVYAAHMTPTRSKGPSSGKVGVLRKSVFISCGKAITSFRVNA